MSGTASSPFVDSPSRTRDVAHEYHRENAKINSDLQISRLEFQLKTMQTEKKLWQQERQSITSLYESELEKKNEELKNLKSNFDFVYKQNQNLESKVKNESETSGKKLQNLTKKLEELQAKYDTLSTKYQSLTDKNDRLIRKHKQVTHDWNSQIKVNDDLSNNLKDKSKIIESLQQSNKEFVDKLEQYTELFKNDNSLYKINQNLMSKNANLQRTNNQLQLKIDQLLQNKTSNELLQQKNISLTNKLEQYEEMRVKCYKLEIEKVELEARFNEYFNTLSAGIVDGDGKQGKDEEDDDDDDVDEVTKTIKVKNFVQTFKDVQSRSLALSEKYDSKALEVNELRQELEDSIHVIENEYLPTITELQEKNQSLSTRVAGLERDKLLASKEIEALRLQLKEMENYIKAIQPTIQNNINNHQNRNQNKNNNNDNDDSNNNNNNNNKDRSSNRNPSIVANTTTNNNNKQMSEYITNLEKLIDDYKRKVDELQTKLVTQHELDPMPSNKRRHTEETNQNSFRKTVVDLEARNLLLLADIKRLEMDNRIMRENLSIKKVVDTNNEQIKILEFKNNLLAKDQFVKQETLDALRKENEGLIAQYVTKLSGDELIPKALFERQEDDKANLQLQIEHLAKRLQRMKEVFKQKSRDILVVISKYFGYSIEFLPSTINPNELSTRLKLVSKYIPKEKNTYLIIDIDNKTLKAYGDYEFKMLCESLASQWVTKSQFPCLLSALNLKLYEMFN